MTTDNCDPECQRKYLDRSREIVRNEVIEFNISYRNLLENYKRSVAGIHEKDKYIRYLLWLMEKYLLEMGDKKMEQRNNELSLLYQQNFDKSRLEELKLNNDAQLRWDELVRRENELLQKIYSDNFREVVRADKARDVATINADKSVKIEEIRASRDNYKIDSETRLKLAELGFEKEKLFHEWEKPKIKDKVKQKKNKLDDKRLKSTDRFHVYISGGTSGGKSEVIKTLIKYHLKSPRKAIVIIDPKNDLAEQVAKFKDNDPDRLVYIEVKLDVSKTFVFNPFDLPEEFINDNRSLIQESLLNSFEIMLENELSDAMKAFLSPCIDLMLDHPHGSYQTLRSLLKGDNTESDDAYNRKLKVFSEDYLNGTYDQTKNAIIRRLDFLLQGDFAKVTTGESTIKLRELIKENKLIIFNLKGLAHKEALGALLIAQVQNITMSRHVDDIKNKTYLIIDECQNFIMPSIDKILTEARSSSLFLVLANQQLSQIKDSNIIKSIKGNTHFKIITRQTEPATAKELGDIIGVNPEELKRLKPKKGECYIKIEPMTKAMLVRNKSKLIDDSFAMTDDEWKEIIEQQLTKYYTRINDEPTEDYSDVRV